MSSERGSRPPLDADAVAVLGVLSRGYRKMTTDDLAHAHVFNRVSTDRVAHALDDLEQAGLVRRHVPPAALRPRAEPARFGLTPLGRSAALGGCTRPETPKWAGRDARPTPCRVQSLVSPCEACP